MSVPQLKQPDIQCKTKQRLAYVLVLFVFLAQFALLVHATEHPFHQDEIVCASYLHAEQNKYLTADGPFLTGTVLIIAATLQSAAIAFVPPSYHHYLQRAPPAKPEIIL